MTFATFAEIGGMVVSLLAALVAIGGLWKVVAEVTKMRSEVNAAATSSQTAAAQLVPNGGASVRDSLTRVETELGRLSTDIDDVKTDIRQLRSENLEDRSAAKQDRADLMQVIDERDASHASMWRALNDLRGLHAKTDHPDTTRFPPSRGHVTDKGANQ